MKYACFGPGGNGDWFRADGMKTALQTPGWLKSKGIDAFEYEATRGVNASEEMLRAFGEKAREHGIRISFHASYFISLSSLEEEKRLNSVRYITQAVRAAELIGAHTVVIHSGSTAKMPREEAMALSMSTLEKTLEAVGDTPVRLGIETMGKLNQLGTLDEVIAQCRLSPGRLVPVVDFGHLNCREQGKAFPNADAYRRVFDRIAAGNCGSITVRSGGGCGILCLTACNCGGGKHQGSQQRTCDTCKHIFLHNSYPPYDWN